MLVCSAANAASTYPAQGGFFAEEAVALLRDFYMTGNPKGAPRVHAITWWHGPFARICTRMSAPL